MATFRKNGLFLYESKVGGAPSVEMADDEKIFQYVSARVASIENVDHNGEHFDVVKDREKVNEILESLDGPPSQKLFDFLISNSGLDKKESGN